MVEQVFRLLKQQDLGYDYIENLNEVDHVYHTHRLNYKKTDYQVILAIEKKKMSEFGLKIFFSLPYMFSRKRHTKLPRYLLYAEKIYFFNKSGELIRNRTIQEELYKVIWAHEFLYTAPITKSSKIKMRQFKYLYDVTKKRLDSINYPDAQDELKNKIFGISKILDKSDLDISFALYLFYENAYKCHNISHEISHYSSAEKTQKLKEKIIMLKKQLQNIKRLLEEREKIWPTFESSLNQHAQRKKENERYKIALIKDIISSWILFPFPLKNTLNIFLKDVSKELKNNFMGHKSIQKSIDSCKKELDLLDKYVDNLFNPKIPINKIID
jgi:hypothetical protein